MRLFSRRLGPAAGAALLVGIGFVLGHLRADPLAANSPPAIDKRVVAYVYGNTPITREEFGEYLIHQVGREKVRLFVNRKIIETAAARQNIVVTPQEIDAVIGDDCGKLGMDKGQFIKTVLEQKYNTTLQEWRDDVIRPRLILQRLSAGNIQVTEDELKKLFENQYGEKVRCKVVLWPQDQKRDVLRLYDSIRKDDKAFDDAARSQLHSELAARGGEVDPIGRHSGPGTAKIEEIAFRLKDGQVSEMIDTGGGIMLIKRIGSIPPKAKVTFEQVRPALVKELTDRLIEQEIPKTFARLNKEANPLFVLSPKNETAEEVAERSRRLGVDPAALEPKK